MSDATLTNAQALKLLLELATNPGFRQRFQEKPAAALVEFGIPHETVVNLNAACLAPATLVDGKALQKAHDDFKEKGVNACLSMISPHLKVGATASQ